MFSLTLLFLLLNVCFLTNAEIKLNDRYWPKADIRICTTFDSRQRALVTCMLSNKLIWQIANLAKARDAMPRYLHYHNVGGYKQ